MSRIFTVLAILAVLLLCGNVLLGLSGGDYNAAAHAFYSQGEELQQLKSNPDASPEQIADATARHDELEEAAKALRPRMTQHMLVGIGSALITLLVCSISITYFVGTSKWCKEVVDTYHLDQDFVRRNDQTKRRSFRWATTGALAIAIVVCLGASAEPTWMNAKNSYQMVQPHYLASLLAIAFLCMSFYMQGLALAENGRIIEEIMAEVSRIRAERGMAREKVAV